MSSLDRYLSPLKRRIKLMVGRAVVNLINDTKGIQEMQISLFANETRSKVQRFQDYGMTSNPHEGAEAVAVFVGGSRDHGIIIKVDDKRYRLKPLAKGEVALYTDEGDKIHLKRGNKIDVQTNTFTVNAESVVYNSDTIELNASESITMTTPLARASADLIDNYGSNSDTLGDMRDKYNTHRHDENDSGGPTDPPDNQMGV